MDQFYAGEDLNNLATSSKASRPTYNKDDDYMDMSQSDEHPSDDAYSHQQVDHPPAQPEMQPNDFGESADQIVDQPPKEQTEPQPVLDMNQDVEVNKEESSIEQTPSKIFSAFSYLIIRFRRCSRFQT